MLAAKAQRTRQSNWAKRVSFVLIFFAIIFFALFLALFFVSYANGLPFLEILAYFFTSSFFSISGLLNVLVKTTPLLIATLGTLIAFKCRIWNIGAEGQMALGVMMTLWASLFFDIPGILRIILAFVLSFLAGALWAALAGGFKAKWNVPEIPITLMQNFVALAVLNFLISGPWMPGDMPGYARTPALSEEVRFPFLAFPLNTTFLVSLVLVPIVYFLMYRSSLGYKLRATGESPKAANYSGMNSKKLIVITMFISGGLCALAGTTVVVGEYFFCVKGITGNLGFYAIVCALIARMRPELTPFTSFFVAAVIVGASALSIKGVPGQFVHLAVGILFIASLLETLYERRKA